MRLLLFFLVVTGPLGAWANGFQGPGLTNRRAWAEDLSGPSDLSRALELLTDPDRVLRSSLIDYLSEVQLADPDARQERLSALERQARDDSDHNLREASLRALAKVGDARAIETLVALLEDLPAGGRALIAELFSGDLYLHSLEARTALESMLVDAFREGEGRALSAEVLVRLLPVYGRRLAERRDGGATARERAPLVLGQRHPSPGVRRAAELGLEMTFNRLRELERFEQAERLLARFAEDGVGTRPLLFLRAVGALQEGVLSPERALAMARQLGRSGGQISSFADERWRARAALVEANAHIALAQFDEARLALERASDLCNGLLARRLDLQGRQGASWHRDLLIDTAMVEFTEVFRGIASGLPADDLTQLAGVRRVHVWLLKAQSAATAADLPSDEGLDILFAESVSPIRCVFSIQPHKAWPAERALEVQAQMGRALASVAPREMPGFEPFPELTKKLSDPLRDPQRERLLNAIAIEEVEAQQRAINALQKRRLKLIDPDPKLDGELQAMLFQLRMMDNDLRDRSLADRFYDLRRPSTFALLFAEALRREDRNLESRQVAEELYRSIEAAELIQKQYWWAVRLAALTKLAIGGSYSDAGDPQRAEEIMQEGLVLFEGLQNFFEERGAPGAARSVDGDLADALVSLAVNANVKGKNPARAAEFFERAYELRQDDFMRVLLACYRARSGAAEEARELIEGVPASPRAYYNLACTHALLGEKELSLEYLKADFTFNRVSPAALEKQKAWAREDPDLTNLHEDLRFQLLTEPAQLESAGEQE